MLENSPHNTEGVQEYQRIYHSVGSAKGQMLENSLPNAKGVQELISMKSPHSAKILKVPKDKLIENSLYKAESLQEQIPENSLQGQKCSRKKIKKPKDKPRKFTTQCQRCSRCQSIKKQMSESSPHNSKSVHAQRIHNVKDAQEQIPGITPENSLQITEIVKKNSLHNAESV
ncbi:hypothetical protein F8M41_015158 [Gigaspora margarita]|uniref:Uncharacterized protein n=1 Tax=Gigaspora margarita TaxID=4874 RepID=A0A8H4ENB3_GIGMA|nr:hypothetical protein F8M41_015158 [Gigaspora margarita]